MSCNDCGGADTTCSDCADKRIAALEAKLAEMTKERDAAVAVWGAQIKTTAGVVLERNALRAEVARLRAAIEPTAANVQALVFAWKSEGRRSALILPKDTGAVHAILAAIRARAGEVSAPGSSLRERVEEALVEASEGVDMITGDLSKFHGAGSFANGARRVIMIVRAALGEP